MVVTNVMRLLKQAGIGFETSEYEVDENDLSGVHLAEVLGVDVDCVFKTLVTRSDKRNLYVFCIPAAQELDLKKAASAVREKKLEMVQVKELLALTISPESIAPALMPPSRNSSVITTEPAQLGIMPMSPAMSCPRTGLLRIRPAINSWPTNSTITSSTILTTSRNRKICTV